MPVLVVLLAGVLAACGDQRDAASPFKGVDASVTATLDGDRTAAELGPTLVDAAAFALDRKFGTDLSGAQVYVTTSTAYGAVVGAEYPKSVPVVVVVKVGDFTMLDASTPAGVTALPTGRTAIVALNEDGSLFGASLLVDDVSVSLPALLGEPRPIPSA